MSQGKKIKIQYLTCNQGDLHEGEQLNYVCLDTKVAANVLQCPVCKTQNDKKQKMIPFKIFLADTSQYLQSKSGAYTVESLLEQVESIHQKLILSLRETVQKMANQVKEVEEQVNQSYKVARKRVIDQNQISQNLPQLFEQMLNNNYDQVNSLKADVFKIVENITLTSAGKIEIDFKPQKSVDVYVKMQNEYTTTLNKLNLHFKEQMQKILKVLEKAPPQPPAPVSNDATQVFQFSSTLKASTISLQDNKIANQTTNQNYEKRFALIEPALDLLKKTQFAIKVTNLQNWVGLGICFHKVLKNKSFKFDYNNLGHGSYLISSNGFSWSSSIKEDNIEHKSFTFTTNDIIICEFDPEKKIVTFKKKGNPQKFSMVVKIPENDEVYACVNLCNQGDKVEIAMNEVEEEGIF